MTRKCHVGFGGEGARFTCPSNWARQRTLTCISKADKEEYRDRAYSAGKLGLPTIEVVRARFFGLDLGS